MEDHTTLKANKATIIGTIILALFFVLFSIFSINNNKVSTTPKASFSCKDLDKKSCGGCEGSGGLGCHWNAAASKCIAKSDAACKGAVVSPSFACKNLDKKSCGGCEGDSGLGCHWNTATSKCIARSDAACK